MEPFIGQIMMFGGNFPPRGWAFCDGQLLPISEHTALFSILGTTYGGNGRTVFKLPSLQGRVPIHPGKGTGLADRAIGSLGGAENNTLNITQIPSHTHTSAINVSTSASDDETPTKTTSLGAGKEIYIEAAPNTELKQGSVALENTGAGEPIKNMQPFLVVSYIIALVGIFPSRN